MSPQKFVVLILLVIGCASTASAQRDFEVTPFFGSRFGGSIDVSGNCPSPTVSCTDFFKIKSSEEYGVMGDVSIWGNLEGEFMWNRQPTSLFAHNQAPAPGTSPFTLASNVNLDLYQFGILYQFRDPSAKLRPFVVAGLGLAHYNGLQSIGGTPVLPFTNRFAYNIGGGVKYFFLPHVGLRLEARYSPSHTTTGIQEFCDPFFGCFPATVANKAEQGEVNAGLIFRFK